MMRRSLKSAALLCAGSFALISSAQAATTLTLNTGDGCSTGAGTSCNGNARTFSLGSGADAVNVRVTGWSMNSSMSSISSSSLGMWSSYGGFGVTSSGDWNGNYNLHAIDNHNGFDFVVLQFDRAVELESFKVTPYEIGHFGYKDSDVTYGAGMSDAAWNSSPFSGSGISQLTGIIPFSDFVTNNTNSNSARTVDVTSGAGNLWVIGASFASNRDRKYDNFKLDKIKFTVTPPAVPEPATWAMMILGFGAIGASMRRRKTPLSFA